MAEADETVRRLKGQKGVEGVIIVNNAGAAIKTTYEKDQTLKFTTQLSPLINQAFSSVKGLDDESDLKFLRLRTTKNEIMVYPDKEFVMIVVQKPE